MAKTDTSNQPSIIAPNTLVRLTIPAAEAEAGYTKALARLARRIKQPGFRLGKVPPHIAEEVLKPEAIFEEALQKLIPPIYEAAISKGEHRPLTGPDFKPIKIEKGSDWEIEAAFGAAPEIDLSEYKKACKAGKKEGEKRWEEHLKTHKKAENDQEKEKTQENTKHEHTEAEHDEYLVQAIYQSLVTTLKPSVAELLVRDAVQKDVNELARQLEPLGMTLQDYMKRRQITEEDFSGELAARAIGRLQLNFILDAIIAKEKIEVTDKDIEAELTKQDNPAAKKYHDRPEYRQYITQQLVQKKVQEFLLDV
jgi:FKBP-type peptidyl-prolyl cis-trans isomerase (trigger factor)